MSTSEAPDEQRRLDEFLTNADTGVLVKDRCEAYADSTGDRCRRSAVSPFPYCSDHLHLLDDVDRERLGLNPPKSGV